MTLDLLREKAENATPGPWTTSTLAPRYISSSEGLVLGRLHDPGNAIYVAAWSPEVALALIEYVQANEDRRGSSVLHPGHDERTRRYMDARAGLFGLLGEAK